MALFVLMVKLSFDIYMYKKFPEDRVNYYLVITFMMYKYG